MTTIYKITTPAAKGAMFVQFKDGQAKEVLIQFEPKLPAFEKMNLAAYFPFDEAELSELNKVNFAFVELKPRTVPEKIALFCMMFREKRGTAYTMKKNEKANLADVVMSKDTLNAYFDNTDYPLTYAKSVNDYIKHYNHIRDLAVNGKPVKSSFPDIYDGEYARTLEGEKLSAYWQHLKKLGWTKTDAGWVQSLFKS